MVAVAAERCNEWRSAFGDGSHATAGVPHRATILAMGQMTYAGATQYDIDDRMLAHLVLVLSSKLRRQEAFMLMWDVENGALNGSTDVPGMV